MSALLDNYLFTKEEIETVPPYPHRLTKYYPLTKRTIEYYRYGQSAHESRHVLIVSGGGIVKPLCVEITIDDIDALMFGFFTGLFR